MDKRRLGSDRHRHGGHSGHRQAMRVAPDKRLRVKRKPFKNKRTMLGIVFAGFIIIIVMSLILFVLMPWFVDGKIITDGGEHQYTVLESIVREMDKAREK